MASQSSVDRVAEVMKAGVLADQGLSRFVRITRFRVNFWRVAAETAALRP